MDMSENGHGKRFKPSEKHVIMDYLTNHTYKQVSERFKVSEPTIARWRKSMMSESNSLLDKKIHLTLPDFWFEYLNEILEGGALGDNYNQVFVNILRNYAKNQIAQKQSSEAFSQYLRKINDLITNTMKRSPEIEAFLVVYQNKILIKTEEWGDPSTILSFVKHWDKNIAMSNKIPPEMESFKIGDELFGIRDFSGDHILAGTRCDPWWNDDKRKLIVGVKRIEENEELILFARTRGNMGDYHSLMDTVKRLAMGKLPNRPEVSFQKEIPIVETRETKRIKRKELRVKKYISIINALGRGFSHERIFNELEFPQEMIDDAIKWDQAGRPDDWEPYKK